MGLVLHPHPDDLAGGGDHESHFRALELGYGAGCRGCYPTPISSTQQFGYVRKARIPMYVSPSDSAVSPVPVLIVASLM